MTQGMSGFVPHYKDEFHLAYQNEERKIGVKFQGFGVTNIEALQKHPNYDKWIKAVEKLAKEIFELE